MSDYKDIIRKPETLNWFKAAMAINITRDCLLDILKQVTQEFYHTIRTEINIKHGIPENVVCSHCNTPNVLPCDAENQCCKYGKCAFHEIHKPRNCCSNLCNEICKEIVHHHRFRNRSKTNSFRGPTWVNTDASQWCANPWQIAKCYLSKDGYKGVNKAEETDFNGIVNVIYNCEFFQRYFTDDLTQTQNVCTKARDVRQAVCHSSSMCMASHDSERAINALVALLQSLKHVDHQAAGNTAVDKLTQLKNNTLAITDEDVAKTFETFKESLTEEIKKMLLHEKDKLVMTMDEALKNTGKHITAEIIKAGDEQIARIKRTCEDDSGSNSKCSRKELDMDTHSGTTGDDIAPGATIASPFARGSPLFTIQAWLIEQYRAMCVVPVSMLDPDIDVPLERIYVPRPSSNLKEVRKTNMAGVRRISLQRWNQM